MNYSEFVTEVRDRAQLETLGDAVSAVRATLQALGEHLRPKEVEELSAQLPELSFYLYIAESQEDSPEDAFLNRIAQGERVDLPEAPPHADTVIQILREYVCSNGSSNLCVRLSEDHATTLEANGRGDRASN